MQGQDRSIIIRWQRPDTIADRRPRATPPRVSGDGAVSFNRMPRIQQPLPRGEVKLPSPPTADHGTSFNWISTLMPLAGVIVTASVYGGLRRDWRLALPMIIMSGFSATGSLVARMIQRVQHRRRAEREAAAYAQVLEQRRSELAELRRDQQRIRHAVDPDLETVLERARTRDPRLWARRPSDSDFLQVRLGLGSLPSTVSVSAPQPAVPTPHLVEVQKLAAEYAAVPDVPVTLSLRDGPAGIAGVLERRTAAARALICHLAAHHAPHEVRLRAIMTPDDLADWHWLKWLPHTQALRGGIPTLAAGEAAAQAVLKDLLEVLQYRQNRLDTAQHGDPTPRWPWLVVLATDVDRVRNDPAIHLLLSPIGRELHATAVFLVDRIPLIPTGCQTVVEILPDGQAIRSALDSDGTRTCQLEGADVSLSDALARCLTPLCAEALRPDGALPSQVRLLDLMGIADVTTHDVAAHWLQRSGGQSLQVPIGQRRGRQPMILDLNHTGHGPHGLVAGTTGSGKSELLQTLVVALALTHHPYDVGFVLVDFKGGGAFSDLVDLPHTQGFVTDLSGRLTERALLALRAEVDRRKRLFNAAGVNDIVRYQQRYWRGEVSQPLPRLVVIVDEFAELVSDHPDFIDGLIGIARIGRSLGVHLILATQSPAGVVKQQIWANARFRICLRVESRQESLEMLHRPEAADLPRQPGRGYFQVGNNDVFELFQVARVASEYPTPAADAPPAEDETPITIERILPLGARIPLLDTAPSCQEDDRSADRRTDIEAVVERLAQIAQQLEIEKLPSPWPDPLPARVALPDLLAETGAGGWDGTDWQPSPSRLRLSPPIGLLDDPANQRQMPVLLDLRQQDGQLIIIGAPGSGKTMLGRTLVSGLARTHTPAELHLYLLEFGGQALQLFRGLPHVGGVFTPLDGERVRRLFRRLLDRLEERKRLCAEAHVDGLEGLRAQQPGHAPPAVVLVVTGFATFRAALPEETLTLTRLVREGGPYGIHAVLMGDRAGDVPTSISSVVARRIALRLADANEYTMILGAMVRPDNEQDMPPGRGWMGRPPLAFQAASPIAADEESEELVLLQQMAAEMDNAWTGSRPAPVEILPASLPLRRLLALAPQRDPKRGRLAVPIGLDDARLEPVTIDLVRDGPHFLVASTPQGGKTTLLTTWAVALAHRSSPREIQFLLVAGRRDSLAPLARLPHVLDYCPRPEEIEEHGVLSRLMAEIEHREALSGASRIDIDDLPHIVMMIDDYDELFGAVGGRPMVQTALERVARRGRDVGMHIVVAGPLPNMGVGYGDTLVRQVKLGRSGFVLRVLEPGDQNPLAVRVPSSDLTRMPPGRGYVMRNGVAKMLQVATTGDETTTSEWIATIQRHWSSASHASWSETATEEPKEE